MSPHPPHSVIRTPSSWPATVAVAFVVFGSGACRDDGTGPADLSLAPAEYNPDWTEATHGKVAPDYEVVFPQRSVNALEITLGATGWTRIRTNMKALTGTDFGVAGGQLPGGGDVIQSDPDYVDVTVRFNGKQWRNVGFRLKGNSSLRSAWRAGIYKLPFRLHLDRFEDSVPAIEDQRFYGFRELSMSPGWQDPSLIREKVAADIFRRAGIPAARTAFYRVFIDFGEGLKYCGVYTAVEVVDDTMVRSQFGSDEGNVYKPESRFQQFVQAQFEKKNNETAADWSDVRALISALNSPLRTSDPVRWREGLEATFDVDHFLRWLAVNNAIVNWDSYGVMAHNYYLYHHAERGLVWIPWDHNESLNGSPGITGSAGSGGGAPGPGGPRGLSLTMNEVAASWPLIRHLADDSVYWARYRAHLKDFVGTVFTEADVVPMLECYHQMIAPHVVGSSGEQPRYTHLATPSAFTNALPALESHVRARIALVRSFVP
ncbi:MAG: spore coat protein CotH [Gemmatimonadetes bacterium]|nr:spore coat protein CotH [Gemmatimonadota bacterium]